MEHILILNIRNAMAQKLKTDISLIPEKLICSTYQEEGIGDWKDHSSTCFLCGEFLCNWNGRQRKPLFAWQVERDHTREHLYELRYKFDGDIDALVTKYVELMAAVTPKTLPS
jgi:hypothetical protein